MGLLSFSCTGLLSFSCMGLLSFTCIGILSLTFVGLLLFTLAMQAVVFCTASLSAVLWMQKCRFPSSKIPEPSNELSIMHRVGDTIDCISHLYLVALWLDPHIAVRPVNLAFCG